MPPMSSSAAPAVALVVALLVLAELLIFVR